MMVDLHEMLSVIGMLDNRINTQHCQMLVVGHYPIPIGYGQILLTWLDQQKQQIYQPRGKQIRPTSGKVGQNNIVNIGVNPPRSYHINGLGVTPNPFLIV